MSLSIEVGLILNRWKLYHPGAISHLRPSLMMALLSGWENYTNQCGYRTGTPINMSVWVTLSLHWVGWLHYRDSRLTHVLIVFILMNRLFLVSKFDFDDFIHEWGHSWSGKIHLYTIVKYDEILDTCDIGDLDYHYHWIFAWFVTIIVSVESSGRCVSA